MTGALGVLGGLVAFLRAQLDHDEALAKAATPGPWASRGIGRHDISALVAVGRGWRPGDFAAGPSIADTGSSRGAADANHMARHNPGRALREIAAKRAIVEWCVEVIGDRDLSGYAQFGCLADDKNALAVTLAVETLRNLATVDSGHPDFREEWTP